MPSGSAQCEPYGNPTRRMTFIQTYAKEIVSLLVPLITWALNRVFRAKVKLRLANPHTFTFLVEQPLLDSQGNQLSPTQTVHTSSYILMNAGTVTATNIELVFNWKPPCLNIWPSRQFSEHVQADRRYVLKLETLTPKEFIGFELLSINLQLPLLITARSDQSVAQIIPMYPQPVAKPWQRRLFTALIFLGMALVVYLLLLLIQYIVQRMLR
jgi:hypothetical protein